MLLVLAQEAHHLQGDGFHTSLIRDGITADLEAEFTATFGGESSDDLDYLYSFQKAVPWRLSPCLKRILKDTRAERQHSLAMLTGGDTTRIYKAMIEWPSCPCLTESYVLWIPIK